METISPLICSKNHMFQMSHLSNPRGWKDCDSAWKILRTNYLTLNSALKEVTVRYCINVFDFRISFLMFLQIRKKGSKCLGGQSTFWCRCVIHFLFGRTSPRVLPTLIQPNDSYFWDHTSRFNKKPYFLLKGFLLCFLYYVIQYYRRQTKEIAIQTERLNVDNDFLFLEPFDS